MGVSGSGKSTVGERLADALAWPFYDADDFHPTPNVEKMGRGEALVDADRWPWLRVLRDLIRRSLEERTSAVLACSALRASYRDVLMEGNEAVVFVYLAGTLETIEARLSARRGHFFNPELLASQFAVLEEPAGAIVIPVRHDPDAMVEAVLRALEAREDV